MNSAKRFFAIFSAVAVLIAAGLGIVHVRKSTTIEGQAPLPLRTGFAPLPVLQESIEQPYDMLFKEAVRAEQTRRLQARRELIQELRQLRTRWQMEESVAAIEASGNRASTGRL